jgi:AGCS family alanine or glycine:cation symporter
MKKKTLAIIFFFLCLTSLQTLDAADIKGKVILSPKGEPYTQGIVLLRPLEEEYFTETALDLEGNFIYSDLKPGKYIIKMDLYELTPFEEEIEIKDRAETLELNFTISLDLLDKVLIFITKASDFMWSYWMIALLLGTGILLTYLTRFKSDKEEGDISPYAALMTALAATVGNGNIAGVATAIAVGGPGAPVWMWIAGVFGMATKYAEGFLGVKFRIKNVRGEMSGGPMYYARNGIKNEQLAKFMGMLFAVCGAIACLLGTGNMMQSNSMALVFNREFQIPFWITGLVVTGIVGAVILGGIKRIGKVSERLVPTMIILYFGGAIFIILARITNLPDALTTIFTSAFSVKAVGGGMVGVTIKLAISQGIRRGLLSNESGLGSAGIAQSASRSKDPSRNGLPNSRCLWLCHSLWRVHYCPVFFSFWLFNTSRMVLLRRKMPGIHIWRQDNLPLQAGFHHPAFHRIYHPGSSPLHSLVHRRCSQRFHGLP